MLKAIVFDFDGVIVDSEPLHYRAFLRIAERRDIHFSYEKYLERYLGFDDRDAFAAMLTDHGQSYDDGAIAHMVSLKADAFEAVLADGIETIPGVERLIRSALEGGAPIAIASGATRRDIDLVLGRLKLTDQFAPIIAADMVAKSKPHPASYMLAAAGLADRRPELALLPGECLAIEDTAAGIESARGAGLMTLGLASTGPAEKLVRAQRVVESLEGVDLRRLREWFA